MCNKYSTIEHKLHKKSNTPSISHNIYPYWMLQTLLSLCCERERLVMCGEEYPAVNTEAVSLFSPTDFLWGLGQDLVLESDAASSTLFTSQSASCDSQIRVMLNSNSSSCSGFSLTPSAWPTYIKGMDFQRHSRTFRMLLKDWNNVLLVFGVWFY